MDELSPAERRSPARCSPTTRAPGWPAPPAWRRRPARARRRCCAWSPAWGSAATRSSRSCCARRSAEASEQPGGRAGQRVAATGGDDLPLARHRAADRARRPAADDDAAGGVRRRRRRPVRPRQAGRRLRRLLLTTPCGDPRGAARPAAPAGRLRARAAGAGHRAHTSAWARTASSSCSTCAATSCRPGRSWSSPGGAGRLVVVVTDEELSPAADIADIVLPVAVDGVPFDSFAGLMTLVEVLVEAVFQRLGEVALDRMREWEESVQITRAFRVGADRCPGDHQPGGRAAAAGPRDPGGPVTGAPTGWADQVAVVTGTAQGIGAAIADALERGAAAPRRPGPLAPSASIDRSTSSTSPHRARSRRSSPPSATSTSWSTRRRGRRADARPVRRGRPTTTGTPCSTPTSARRCTAPGRPSGR